MQPTSSRHSRKRHRPEISSSSSHVKSRTKENACRRVSHRPSAFFSILPTGRPASKQRNATSTIVLPRRVKLRLSQFSFSQSSTRFGKLYISCMRLHTAACIFCTSSLSLAVNKFNGGEGASLVLVSPLPPQRGGLFEADSSWRRMAPARPQARPILEGVGEEFFSFFFFHASFVVRGIHSPLPLGQIQFTLGRSGGILSRQRPRHPWVDIRRLPVRRSESRIRRQGKGGRFLASILHRHRRFTRFSYKFNIYKVALSITFDVN